MLGQGKNVWQAEIDAAAEVKSFCKQLSLSFLESDIRPSLVD